ncbi:neuronal acetylcholine receptor subunit alpha-10-like [Glandiceps talaboti]
MPCVKRQYSINECQAMDRWNSSSVSVIVCWVIMLISTNTQTTESRSPSNETQSHWSSELVRALFRDHQKYVRPVLNRSTAVTVKHRMTPIQILNIDEMNQIISMKTWMSQIWKDEFLSWDPADFGGVEEIRVPITEVWQPDITLVNGVNPGFQRHYDTDAIITSDGTITALQPDVLQASCRIDARYFPFDKQACLFVFASWSYPGDTVDLVLDPNSNTDLFISNGEWQLLGMPKEREAVLDPCCTVPFPKLTYTMHLLRRSAFYIFNIILPSFLASVLVAVAFYLPSDSGERVTLWVTSILSQFVFLNVVSEFMPPNSEHLPYLQRYFFASIGLVAFSSIVIAGTLSMHFKGPHCQEPPNWLRYFVFRCCAPLVCERLRAEPYLRSMRRKIKEKKKKTRNGNNKRKSKSKRTKETQFETYNHGFVDEFKIGDNDFYKRPNGVFVVDGALHRATTNVPNHVEAFSSSSGSECEEDEQSELSFGEERRRVYEWRALARIIDRVYLIIYVTALCGLLLGFMIALYIQSIDIPDYSDIN